MRALALVAAAWSMSAEAADMNYGSRAPYTVNQPVTTTRQVVEQVPVDAPAASGQASTSPQTAASSQQVVRNVLFSYELARRRRGDG